MSAMAFLITSVSIVRSIVCSGADQRKHQSSASLAFMRGIHRWPLNSPHEGPVTRKKVSIWLRHHFSSEVRKERWNAWQTKLINTMCGHYFSKTTSHHWCIFTKKNRVITKLRICSHGDMSFNFQQRETKTLAYLETYVEYTPGVINMVRVLLYFVVVWHKVR